MAAGAFGRARNYGWGSPFKLLHNCEVHFHFGSKEVIHTYICLSRFPRIHSDTGVCDPPERRNQNTLIPNNRADCIRMGGTWGEVWQYKAKSTTLRTGPNVVTGIPYEATKRRLVTGVARASLELYDAPECIPTKPSRENHNGATVDGELLTYRWKIPDDNGPQRVQIRMRYVWQIIELIAFY